MALVYRQTGLIVVKALHQILGVLAVLALVAGSAAQTKKNQFLIPIPEKLERPTAADEQGRLQWKAHSADRCLSCKGTAKMACLHCARLENHADCAECKKTEQAPCRTCAGTGEMPDILKRAPCPTCFGASVTRCFICGGAGRITVAGGGKKMQKCGCCKGVGAYPCTTCKGKRFVEPPKLKPEVGQARPEDLEKAQAALAKVAAGIASFKSTGQGRKDMKAYAKAVMLGRRYFPPLQRAAKHFENVSKKQSKGAVWREYGEMVENQAKDSLRALDYYLKHQQRLLDLCTERAWHNRALDAGKK